MNYLANGQVAVGSPGSIERVKVEYPELVADIGVMFPRLLTENDLNRAKAYLFAKQNWNTRGKPIRLLSDMEIESILVAAGHPSESSGL